MANDANQLTKWPTTRNQAGRGRSLMFRRIVRRSPLVFRAVPPILVRRATGTNAEASVTLRLRRAKACSGHPHIPGQGDRSCSPTQGPARTLSATSAIPAKGSHATSPCHWLGRRRLAHPRPHAPVRSPAPSRNLGRAWRPCRAEVDFAHAFLVGVAVIPHRGGSGRPRRL